MKRILAFALIFMACLCGCKGKSSVKPRVKDISFLAEISLQNEKFSFKTETRDKTVKCSVVSPKEYKGLSFIFEKDTECAEFMGIIYTPESGKLPAFSAAKILNELLRSLPEDLKLSEKNGKNLKYVGRISVGEYELSLSPSGYLLSARIESANFSASFSDLTLI